MPAETHSPYLTAPEAAAYLRVRLATIRRWTSRREMPCVRAGRRTLYKPAALDAWVAGRDAA
jgi:excisionase family DNA binding protein